MGSCQHWLILDSIIVQGRYHSSPVDESCFLTLTLCWIGRLHTNPIRSRVHSPRGPQWIRRPRDARAKELLLILEMLILLMEKLPLIELFLCTNWVFRQSLHLGRPVVYGRWILCAIVSSWEYSWATRTNR